MADGGLNLQVSGDNLCFEIIFKQGVKIYFFSGAVCAISRNDNQPVGLSSSRILKEYETPDQKMLQSGHCDSLVGFYKNPFPGFAISND